MYLPVLIDPIDPVDTSFPFKIKGAPSVAKKRNYKSEYANYQGSEEQKRNRASRGRARYSMMKKGRVKLGDGVDVIHKDDNPSNNSKSNLGTQPKSINRSFRRSKNAGMKNRGKGLGHE